MSGYQLAATHNITDRVGALVYFLLSILGTHQSWTCTGLVHVSIVSVNAHVCHSERYSWSHPSLSHGLLLCSCLFFYIDLWSLNGRALRKTYRLIISVWKISFFLHIVQLWISVSTTIYQEQAYLMMVNWRTDRWVYKNIISSHIITILL